MRLFALFLLSATLALGSARPVRAQVKRQDARSVPATQVIPVWPGRAPGSESWTQMGFSAGGMITMGVVEEHDAQSRPNFAAPIYGPGFGEVKVPGNAPPLFILCASDDPLAASGSVRLYSQWRAAAAPPSCISTRRAATASA